jgi:hypothetical protein
VEILRQRSSVRVSACHYLNVISPQVVCVSVQHLEHLGESAPLDWFQTMAGMPVEIKLSHENQVLPPGKWGSLMMAGHGCNASHCVSIKQWQSIAAAACRRMRTKGPPFCDERDSEDTEAARALAKDQA